MVAGLWQIADMEREQEIDLHGAAHALQTYVNAGITSFDMADHYGSAELIAGIYREQYQQHPVQLLTKWVPEPGPSHPSKIQAAIERALQRLKSTQIDLLQYHAWNYPDPSWLDDLHQLHELKEKGLIKNLGVTNFDSVHLKMALDSGIELVSNQISYSLLDLRASNKMAEVCEQFGVKILAFGTLAGGFLTHKWLGKPEPESLATWSQMKYKRYIDAAGGWSKFQNLLVALNQLASDKRCSMANVATRYILDKPGVAGVIIGARLGESEYIAENLHALEISLNQTEREEIEDLIKNLNSIPGDCGDEYRKPPFLTAKGDLSDHISGLPKPYKPQKTNSGERILSGTVWEEMAGYSRAVKTKNRILISGTTATHKEQVIGGNDPASQTHFIIDKIEGVLQSLNSSLEDVVRTRVYIKYLKDWEGIAKAHGERFSHIKPANTMIQANLIGEEYLVEIEAEAIVEDGKL